MMEPEASLATAVPFSSSLCAPENRRFVLIAAILASALGFIDGTVVAIALPAMRASLDADLVAAQWIHNSYLLMLTSLILVGGALGDRFGLVRVFAAGIATFVAASMVCAVAPDVTVMVIARALQGLGAAIMVPGSLAIIARAYPREDRGRAIGIWASASAVTTAAGPILGGLALSIGGPEMWRAIFAINLPLGGLALWLLLRKSRGGQGRPGVPIDWGGAALATAALMCVAWGLTQAGHAGRAWPWILAGGALMAAFLWTQARNRYPMMPLGLFSSRVFSAANAMSFALYAALGMTLFFLPMTLIAGWDHSEIEASAAFAPFALFIGAFSARFGRLSDRIGAMPLLVSGCLLTSLGYGTLGLLAAHQNLWAHVLPAMCIVGLGMACVVAPLSATVMGSVREDQSGIASSINNAVSRLAGLIAVAAIGGLVASLYAGAGGLASFGIESDRAGHAAAMNQAFRGVAFAAAGLSLLSALIATLIRS